ncbi:MAG TPA: type IV toxin-antitoxin system AbiEi family antitoxin domain-containing protein [Acidimicrobiales bacterium]|nr:type IV toxin-antitoxin system AbiEi family antitoxin domain-containing protein [Acidimicrobiales bacterium]
MDLERLRREADDQHRLLRVRDLARFGVTPAAGRRLVEDGWLAPVRPGVVLVGGGAPTDWQRAVAAWLAAGPDAALSHWTAARIHRLAWPEVQVAAECDGWWTRSRSRSKFDHDRRRNNILTARGWSIAHLTTAMSDDEMRAAVVGLLIRAWRR